MPLSLSLTPKVLHPQPSMEDYLCDLKVTINGQHTFFLNQKILCSFSGKLKKMVMQTNNRTTHKGFSEIQTMDFPEGPDGFEMVLKFCYNNGRVPITPSNISLLHCCGFLLEMTEEVSTFNLLTQTETLLNGVFNWNWSDILTSLRNCEPFLHIADSSGLLLKLISAVVSKISENSDILLTETPRSPSSPSSCSSPDTPGFRYSLSAKTTPESSKHSTREWWFDSLAILPPTIIQQLFYTIEAYGSENRNLILTKFLLHYLKTAQRAKNGGMVYKLEYGGLADTAVYGVVLMGRAGFSYRGLFRVLRLVSGFKVSKKCRQKLERLIGMKMEKATLDDLLVSGNGEGVYDVNLVLRLIRVFVNGFEESGGVRLQRLKKVGWVIDKYLREISPDQNLKVEKFLMVAESLPDSARDCFDGVYRALDTYLQSHPRLSSEECSRLCRCLNYKKLTLEACRDLAKTPRIPPGAAIQALISQQFKIPTASFSDDLNSIKARKQAVIRVRDDRNLVKAPKQAVIRVRGEDETTLESSEEKEELRFNQQKMQNKVIELEKVCMQMKAQMNRVVKTRAIISQPSTKGLPRLC